MEYLPGGCFRYPHAALWEKGFLVLIAGGSRCSDDKKNRIGSAGEPLSLPASNLLVEFGKDKERSWME